LNDQEDRRQSREQTLSLRHSAIQFTETFDPFAFRLIKKTGGNQDHRRFLFTIRQLFSKNVLKPSSFERSRRPEAIKNKDVLSWPFDNSMRREVYLGSRTPAISGRKWRE
jgi:hypothetical protein